MVVPPRLNIFHMVTRGALTVKDHVQQPVNLVTKRQLTACYFGKLKLYTVAHHPTALDPLRAGRHHDVHAYIQNIPH